MPSWNKVLEEIAKAHQQGAGALDAIRRKYLRALHKHSGRNVIAYYSAWLDRPRIDGVNITDLDMNGFMNSVHRLDQSKGLDLILHTPGGEVAAAESIVSYLRQKFGTDVRAIIPQLAMSAGTMIACSCKSIVMGKQSSIGPIDPQFGIISAKGVKEEFERAMAEVKADPSRAAIWQVIISKYHPTFVAQCESACVWAESLVAGWLEGNMLSSEPDPKASGLKVASDLADLGILCNHGKHLSQVEAASLGLKVETLESDQTFQDLVLTVHHSYMHTIANAPVVKIIENHLGAAIVHRTKEH